MVRILKQTCVTAKSGGIYRGLSTVPAATAAVMFMYEPPAKLKLTSVEGNILLTKQNQYREGILRIS